MRGVPKPQMHLQLRVAALPAAHHPPCRRAAGVNKEGDQRPPLPCLLAHCHANTTPHAITTNTSTRNTHTKTTQPINKEETQKIFGPAAMHAIGHIAANISFAAVAISLTHTVKTLEPAFNVLLSRLILGEATPLPVVATLVPIMAGVALASAGELSFNWTGFISAMLSNLTFGFRAVWGKA